MFKKIKIAARKFLMWIRRISYVIIPVAVDIAEGIKKAINHPAEDVISEIIKGIIPGKTDDIIIDKVRKLISENIVGVITSLKMVESIATIKDPNKQLKAILASIKFSSKDEANEFYAKLAASVAEKLSDGRLTIKEAYELTQEYYNLKKGLK